MNWVVGPVGAQGTFQPGWAKLPGLFGARNKFLANPDGSVELYLQADLPGKAKEQNWLPAPNAQFIPMMRLYWPKDTPPSIIDGTWKPQATTVSR
jgi:hypothetical protein